MQNKYIKFLIFIAVVAFVGLKLRWPYGGIRFHGIGAG